MKSIEQKASSNKPSFLKRLMRRFLAMFAFALLLGCIAGGLFLYFMYDYLTRPRVAGEPVRFVVPEGVSGRQIGELLAKQQLVDNEQFFRMAILLDKSGKPIKSGDYELHRGLSPMQLLQELQDGPNAHLVPGDIPPDRKVTIPEGLSIAQAAKLFKDPQAFIDAATDPQLVAKLGLPVTTLEGCLMPDTYFFDRPPTEREVVERMLDSFLKTRDALYAEYPDAAERNFLEVVTVASLVEEEARVSEERPMVAAVIYNRIAEGIPLCFDSTLQFALGKYGQRMLDRDKEVDSPYNTYKYAGLPPGPISSPGKASLRSALRPDEAKYLYFVSNADGKTHTFSETMADHNKAVAQYRKEIAVQRRELGQKGSNDTQSN